MTLHVGLDTFQPIREEVVEDHRIHRETYSVEPGGPARPSEAPRGSGDRAGGRGHDGHPGAGDAGPRRASSTRPAADGSVVRAPPTSSSLPAIASGRRRAAHQLPSAAEHRAGADHGLRRESSASARPTRRPSLCGYRFFSFGDAMLIEPLAAAPDGALARKEGRVRRLDGLPDFPFTVEARDGAARAGLLETPRGTVRTPCFMPVGTKGTVKAMLAGASARSWARRSSWPTPITWPCGPGSDVVRRSGGAAPVHAVGRPHPHRQRGLSGLQPARHRPHRRRGRRLPLHLRRLQARVHARAGHGRAGGPGGRLRHVLRPVPARNGRPQSEVAESGGADRRAGPRAARRPTRPRAAWAPTGRRCCSGSRRGEWTPELRRESVERDCWRSAFPATPSAA